MESVHLRIIGQERELQAGILVFHEELRDLFLSVLTLSTMGPSDDADFEVVIEDAGESQVDGPPV